MPLGDRRQHALLPSVLFHAPPDLAHRGPRAVLITLIHDDDVREVEHDDFLQLQPRPVIRIHHQHRLINELALKRHRFLSGANRLDDEVIEAALGQELKAIFRRGRQATGLPARRHAAHENPIVLRIDHGRAVAQERARADHARIVGKDRDARFRVALQKSQDQLINERRLARASRSRKTDDACRGALVLSSLGRWALGVGRWAFLLPLRIAVLNLGQLSRELHLSRGALAATMLVRLSVALVHEIDHVRQRCPREENLIDSALLHHPLVVMGDGPAAAAKHRDVVRAPLAKLFHHFNEKLDVPAVVAGDADGAHILLDRRAHDVLRIAMIAEVNDLDPVPDEFEVDRVDRAVMPVADRNSGKNSDRCGHGRLQF